VSTAAITVAHVSKRLGSHQALADVSLDIAPGTAVVVLGPSGCGKTTLLRLIAGLDVPDDGHVAIHGIPVSEPGRVLVPPHRRGVGLVFQDLALWPHLTVRDNLAFVLASKALPKAERAARTEQALGLVRIESLATRYPHQLSGGEQQRAALARAVVGEPRVLLLDEPFSSLDDELRTMLRAELTRLRRELMITMVYVTHDREDAAELAERVVEMQAGRVVSVTSAERSGLVPVHDSGR
jgi:iron(III) transport system ATP-binding protein